MISFLRQKIMYLGVCVGVCECGCVCVGVCVCACVYVGVSQKHVCSCLSPQNSGKAG
jgi:hypothetical protein